MKISVIDVRSLTSLSYQLDSRLESNWCKLCLKGSSIRHIKLISYPFPEYRLFSLSKAQTIIIVHLLHIVKAEFGGFVLLSVPSIISAITECILMESYDVDVSIKYFCEDWFNFF